MGGGDDRSRGCGRVRFGVGGGRIDIDDRGFLHGNVDGRRVLGTFRLVHSLSLRVAGCGAFERRFGRFPHDESLLTERGVDCFGGRSLGWVTLGSSITRMLGATVGGLAEGLRFPGCLGGSGSTGGQGHVVGEGTVDFLQDESEKKLKKSMSLG